MRDELALRHASAPRTHTRAWRLGSILLVAFTACATLSAQPAADSGPAAHALCGAVTARDDPRFATWNPAAALVAHRSMYASARTSAGGLAGLTDAVCSYLHPIDTSMFLAGSLSAVAYGPYRLVTVALGGANRLSDDISAGASVRIETEGIDAYGVSSTVLLDLGMLVRLLPAVTIGVVVRNASGSSLRGHPRPSRIAVGVMAPLADSVDVSLDIAHEAGRGIDVAVGSVIRIDHGIVLRAGSAIVVPALSCGFGYDDGSRLVDASIGWNDAAGFACAAGAGLRW